MKKGLMLLVVLLLWGSTVASWGATLQPASKTPGWSFQGVYYNSDNDKNTMADPVVRYVGTAHYGFMDYPVEVAGIAGINQISNVDALFKAMGGTGGKQDSSYSFGANVKYGLIGGPGTMPGALKGEFPVDVALSLTYVTSPTKLSGSGVTVDLTQNDLAYGAIVSRMFLTESATIIPYGSFALDSRNSSASISGGGGSTSSSESLTVWDVGAVAGMPSLPNWWLGVEYGNVTGFKSDGTGSQPANSKDSVLSVFVSYVMPTSAPSAPSGY